MASSAQATKTPCCAPRPAPAGETRASSHSTRPGRGGWVEGTSPLHGSSPSASGELTCTTGTSE
ncbi:hypothetical protein [Ornithinimicrobium kibberense]|uniref:hypothetical protein n=1 Tax=Ornithinimicrobium kibberense TaxID=282060 RepID=UPI003623B559